MQCFPFRPSGRNGELARLQARLLDELARIDRKLILILDKLASLNTEGAMRMAWIDDMRTALEINTSVTQSAVVALNTLADKVQELINAGADPVELQDFVDTLRANDAALSQAIEAGTQAMSEPAPDGPHEEADA